ncbi:hypothetical protein MKMG_00457 [Methanogenium sp. MK-MG]|nr:hypothetical protein MKMG_00457 [Methanogenium sp. MK-MG]
MKHHCDVSLRYSITSWKRQASSALICVILTSLRPHHQQCFLSGGGSAAHSLFRSSKAITHSISANQPPADLMDKVEVFCLSDQFMESLQRSSGPPHRCGRIWNSHNLMLTMCSRPSKSILSILVIKSKQRMVTEEYQKWKYLCVLMLGIFTCHWDCVSQSLRTYIQKYNFIQYPKDQMMKFRPQIKLIRFHKQTAQSLIVRWGSSPI